MIQNQNFIETTIENESSDTNFTYQNLNINKAFFAQNLVLMIPNMH
jgi:hypothetical protein